MRNDSKLLPFADAKPEYLFQNQYCQKILIRWILRHRMVPQNGFEAGLQKACISK
jgi:hypothetical protein